MPKPTEEQILSILNTVARYYSKRYNYQYEVDELVNEVWLMGAIQRISDIKLVWGRAAYDIKHYIRSYSLWRYRGVLKGRDERKKAKRYCLPDRKMENDEQIDFLLEGLPPRERLLLKLLSEGCNQREVAEVLGYTPNWVSRQILGTSKIEFTTEFNAQKHLASRYILQESE